MDYDILILGGGIIGCSIAYELSKYNLNIALIEKDYDIADDLSFINTAIIYDGAECSNDLMSSLENMGNSLIEEVATKFNVPFKRIGSIRIAQTDVAVDKLYKMYDRAKRRGIKDIHLIDEEHIKEVEPNLNIPVKKALYSQNTAVISPYDLALAYAEVAADNGVIFRLEEDVVDIKKLSKGFRVTTSKNKFTCKVVVNTIPGEQYNLNPTNEKETKIDKKLYYLLVDDSFKECNDTLVINEREESNGFVFQTPTLSLGTLVAVKSDVALSYEELIKTSNSILPNLSKRDINYMFSDEFNVDSMLIDESEISKGYINVTGDHYGEVTIAPALSQILCESLVNNLKCTLKRDFIDKRREYFRFRELSDEQKNELIKIDDRYGNVVCLCNTITEGEIVDAIRRPLGARTVEGIKRRTGATFGNCHGSYCIDKVINILAREMDKKLTDIVEDSKNSNLLVSRIKEFDEV
ncbi:NAD(P)/FAD-dependent oxidoreductase [Clostridium sp. 'White wine YQ']|uniref:NAD(P)/FAD-dependent oxidoreductase n=1 Tax=Clostridium sp. 'White wine YQ' TaxID=3027474 RepID=UPI00236523D3|nr:FAD-dependent oxidoreductase [Clostridium sp. 'White wine YQ']MDD7796015.1 FAD-dependent oxidoreductase [Clostridium sp. 'White wine YQ']